MYWFEIGLGVYVFLLILVSIVLHEKRGTDFAYTYMCGVALGGVVWVIVEAIITKGHINFIAILLSVFAGYLVLKKKA